MGAVFGFVLGASLLPVWRGRTTGAKPLSLLLMVVSLAVASITLQHHRIGTLPTVWLELVEVSLGFCSGPILLMFCRRGDPGAFRVPARVALHFVPAAIVTGLIMGYGRNVVPIESMMAHQIAYTAWAVVEVVRQRLETTRTDAPAIRLCALAVAVHLAQVARLSFSSVPGLRNIVPATLVLGLMVIALLSLRRTLSDALALKLARYQRSRLDDRRAEDLVARLRARMEQARPWLDAELSLQRLADVCELTPHQLSQLLSERLATNFHEYVASWRLEEARRRLADPGDDIHTIEAIATGSGFSSRSTFYSSFRRAFGTTPTQFRVEARRCPIRPARTRPAPSPRTPSSRMP